MSLVLRLMALAFAMNSAPHSAEACDPNDVRSGVVQSALEASIDAEYDAYPGAKITARGIELSIKGDPSELPSIHAAYRGMRARGAKREGNLTLLAHELFLRRAAVRALAPFEPRKDSITLSLRSTASSRSVRGRMVNLTAEELTLEIDGQPVVIRLTDIDHRSVKGIGADRGSLFSRAPGGTIERNFFQNALEAGSFFRGWFGSARNVDAASLTEAMHRMHEISARGEKGDRPYQVVDAEGMGYETDKIRVGSFRELDFTLIYEGAD
ncbi:MAG TPA: hypothetical protein VM598_06535, partial [Bdellovibrionota bacterium]|nr:hypothetical protein [Bdellovibrionota bacterium]